MDLKTSNLDFAAFLSTKECKLISLDINHKGICYWTYRNDTDTDLWMAFLRGAEVSAVRYASELRSCKQQAFSMPKPEATIISKKRNR